jgi:hypothetical protein
VIKSDTFQKIKILIEKKDVLISSHGYDELAEDGILVKEILSSMDAAIVLEDYPDFGKGSCCLVLQKDNKGNPIHAVWGISVGTERPAVLITAYRPSDERWSNNYTRRKDAK